MKAETADKLFVKVATCDKAAELLATFVGASRMMAAAKRKSEVQTKVASIVKDTMTKKADAVSDMLGAGGIPGLVGGAIGAFDDPADEEERSKMDQSALRGVLIPGVGGYRTERRKKGILKDDKGETSHYWSHMLGPLTSTGGLALLAGLLGAGGYYAYGKYKNLPNGGSEERTIMGSDGTPLKDWQGNDMTYKHYFDTHADRAGIGGLAGAGAGAVAGILANLGGGLGAAFTKRRTAEDQKKYNNSSTWKNWLLPGNAMYNDFKTIGRVIGDSEERNQPKEKKDKEKKEEKA